jgi:hypothetical protein
MDVVPIGCDKSGVGMRRAGETATISDMISVDLARDLRDAGLHWVPTNGDIFFIPDRGLDQERYAIADMVVDVRVVQGGRQIAFNGAVEWALDAIAQHEVVWLPSETQLRELLGERFAALRADGGFFTCEAMIDGTDLSYQAATAADAYGKALLRAFTGSEPA